MGSIPTSWTGRMVSVWASHGNLPSANWKIAGSLHHMTSRSGFSAGPRRSVHVALIWAQNMPSPGAHQLPTLMSPLPSSTSASSFPPHSSDSPPYTSVPCPTHFFPVFFLDHQNYCSCLLLVRLVVCESPAVSFCPTASQWELSSTLPFPPASYIIGNFLPTSVCLSCLTNTSQKSFFRLCWISGFHSGDCETHCLLLRNLTSLVRFVRQSDYAVSVLKVSSVNRAVYTTIISTNNNSILTYQHTFTGKGCSLRVFTMSSSGES
jgi:hypothetical protein